MIGLQLQPVDTWFFRGGTPFTAGSAPQENVGSVFPPYPPTVAGAVRAALARGQGWDGRSPWSSDVCAVLGDGPEDLGRLSFDGPFLLRNGKPLFVAPRHLLGTREDGRRWSPAALLRPGSPVDCDLGQVRLPELVGSHDEPQRFKRGDRRWLTLKGLNAVLRGGRPHASDVTASRRLWADEPRIGLERDDGSRAAREGMLYSTTHIRPRRGVSLGLRIDGLPSDWRAPFGRVLPLGGESRLAACGEWRADIAFDVPTGEIAAAGRAAVVALSPLDIDADVYEGCQPLTGEFGAADVVSGCIGRPLVIGGWDSRPGGGPLPARPVLAPGSVLFCELRDPARLESAVGSDGTVRIGSRQQSGFGLATLGVWPSNGKEKA